MTRKTMQAVLDSLESFERSHPAFKGEFREEREMLRTALAESERRISYVCPQCHWTLDTEPAEFVCSTGLCRYRKPLTDEQVLEILGDLDPETKRVPPGLKAFARAIEARHGIGYIEHPQGFRVHPVTGDFGIGTPGKGEKE